jgi:hypothetical protein
MVVKQPCSDDGPSVIERVETTGRRASEGMGIYLIRTELEFTTWCPGQWLDGPRCLVLRKWTTKAAGRSMKD